MCTPPCCWKWSFIYSYSVKCLKSQQSALTQLHLAAENGHLEACELHILNDKAVMFILVSKNLIILHKSNKVFKIALLSLLSTLLLKVVIYLFLFCKTQQSALTHTSCCRKWAFGSLQITYIMSKQKNSAYIWWLLSSMMSSITKLFNINLVKMVAQDHQNILQNENDW